MAQLLRRIAWICLCIVAAWNWCSASWGGEPDPASAATSPAALAREVDALLADEVFPASSGKEHQPAPLSTDGQFLRRISLDLIGEPPSSSQVTAFLTNPASDKRSKEIERLLLDKRFGENWARYWRDVILYRRTEERALLVSAAVEDYLAKQLNQGRGWDGIARSFITASGDVREQGNTAIIMAQNGSPEDTAAEVARIFMGVQIQCAQCHDHPTDRWKRSQFHALAAFFPRIVVRPIQNSMPRSFEVASRNGFPGMNRPAALRRGRPLEHYMPDLQNPASRGTLMTPAFFVTGDKLPTGASDAERRESLAKWLTSSGDEWFAKAFVNRIWAELVGEGFYEPVDDLGPDRQATAPKTLDRLAKDFVEHGYDVKRLFTVVALTQAYQRESRPRRTAGGVPFLANVSQPLRGDQVQAALTAALGVDLQPPGQRGGPNPYLPAGLRGPRAEIVRTFGFDPSNRRDEVTGSIQQALLLMNSPLIQRAVNARSDRTSLGRLLASTRDDKAATTSLYLQTLSREPRPEELTECLKQIRRSPTRAEAYEDILWALINSTEFLQRN